MVRGSPTMGSHGQFSAGRGLSTSGDEFNLLGDSSMKRNGVRPNKGYLSGQLLAGLECQVGTGPYM